jgi:hypothetical protein
MTANRKQKGIMKTTHTEIKPAIGRSISHDEIVLLLVPDAKEALDSIDNDENVSELDWSTENNGDLDVWGRRLGEDFRLRIRGEEVE